LVTNHDSLGYFADRYGFQVIGTVVPGGSTLASPSPRDVADLIEIVQAERIAAVFTDATEPDSLAQLVADESGGSVEVVQLYIGALGPIGSGAAGYLEMLQLNVERISGALS
jgi:zinc/manganese transport system substrate-binding protein